MEHLILQLLIKGQNPEWATPTMLKEIGITSQLWSKPFSVDNDIALELDIAFQAYEGWLWLYYESHHQRESFHPQQYFTFLFGMQSVLFQMFKALLSYHFHEIKGPS